MGEKIRPSGKVPYDWTRLATEAAEEAEAWHTARTGLTLTEGERSAQRAGCGAFLHKLVERKVVTISADPYQGEDT